MKKLLTLLVLSLIATLSAMGLAACDLDSGNDSGKEEPPITVHTHVYDEGVTTIEPTCTEKGEITFTCIDGDYSYTEEIAALGHTPLEAKEENRVTPTCTGKGSYNSVVYCAVCGEELSRETVEIEATGHTPLEAKEENRVTPTCTEKGSYDLVVYCTVCGEELSRETIGTEATGHTPLEAKEENRVTSTCTGKGSYDSVVYCAVCGEELSREAVELESLGHNYDAEITEPTCTEQGYTTYTCSRCGDSYIGEYTAPLGHDYEWTVTKEPTENEEGIEAGVCSRCRDTITRDIPKLNHEHNYEETVIAPTCTENGYTLYQCSCGDSYTDNETNALGHNYTESITAPTCIAQGYTTYTCSRCGDSYVDNYVAVTEHNYVDGVCSVCGESEPVSQDGLAELKIKVTALKGQSDTVYEEVINFSYILNDLSSFINVLNNNSYYLSDLFGYDLQQEIEEIYTAVNENIESFNAFGTGFLALQSNVNSLYEIVFSEEYGDINTLLADFEALSQQIAYAIATLNEYSSLLGQAQAVAAEFLSNENIENVIATFNSVYLENADNISEVRVIVTDVVIRIEEGYQQAEETSSEYLYEWEELRNYASNQLAEIDWYYDGLYDLEYIKDKIEGYLFSGEYVLSDMLKLVSAGIDDVSFIISNRHIIEDMWWIEELNVRYNELLMQSGGDIDNYALQILDEMQLRIDDLIALSIEAEESGDWSYLENYVYQLYDLFWQLDDNLSYSLDSWYEYYDSLYYGISEIVRSIEYREAVLLQDNLMGLIVVIEDLKNVLGDLGSGAELEYYFSEEDGGYIVTGAYNEQAITKLEIPDYYEGYPVIGIESWAFDDCERLVSVTIGNNVIGIGDWAFRSCDNLREVILGSGVTNLESAFNGCYNIQDVYYMGTVNQWIQITGIIDSKNIYINGEHISVITKVTLDGITEIKPYAFAGFSGLTEITIPDSVTSIGEDAFYDCSIEIATIPIWAFDYIARDKLKVLTITSGESIEEMAFSDYSSLTEITIPDSVTSIGNYAFQNCSNLTKVNYIGTIDSWCGISFGNVYANPIYYAHNLYINNTPITEIVLENITGIKPYAFYNCSSLEKVTIGNGVMSIGNYAFIGCSSLTSATIGNSVTSIGNSAFYNCSSLTKITIPEAVTSIGNNVFKECSSLTSVTIGNGVTSIGNSAFSGCSIEYAKIPAIAISYIPKENLKTVEITSGESIESRAFQNCSSLEKVTIGNGVTSIGNYAFIGCSSLTSATIGNSVTSIGDGAFQNCSSLTGITIGDSVTNIGTWAFLDCGSLVRVNYTGTASQWTQIDGLFYIMRSKVTLYINNAPVTEVVLEDITEIKQYAFYGYSDLTKITIPDSVISIGDGAFLGCSIEYAKIPAIAISYIPKENLKTVEITSGESIGNYAFYQCIGLTSIIIPDSVTSIGEWAFSYSDLTEITIPDSVISIGSGAFYQCTKLTSIIISDSVISIGNHAFYNCSSLEKITIGNGVMSIEHSAFYQCTKLTSIIIPDSVTSIGVMAFLGCSSLTSVNYMGTIEEWSAISKDSSWKYGVPATVVHCTDGNVAI